MVCLLFPVSTHAEQVWYEWGLATASVGWDTDKKRTLVQKYYLAAVGPSHIAEPAVGAVKACLLKSLKDGATAFKSTPSPEMSARMAAAYATFKVETIACIKTISLASAYADSFEPALIQRQEWQNGYSLKFHNDNPSTRIYRQVGEYIEEEFGGEVAKGLNSMFQFQADLQDIEIDVELGNSDAVATVLNSFAQSARVGVVVAGANDIAHLTSDPLNPDKVREVVANMLMRSIDDLKSPDAFALSAAGIAEDVAKEIENKVTEFLRDKKTQKLATDTILPGGPVVVDLVRKIDPKKTLKQVQKEVENVVTEAKKVKKKAEKAKENTPAGQVEKKVKDEIEKRTGIKLPKPPSIF